MAHRASVTCIHSLRRPISSIVSRRVDEEAGELGRALGERIDLKAPVRRVVAHPPQVDFTSARWPGG